MKPTLSVVIASHNARAGIARCLDALHEQSRGDDRESAIEIIVADNSTDGTAEIVRRQHSHRSRLTLLRCETSLLIPELWQRGIEESAGDIVALTTAHCVPAANWIEEVLRAHRAPHPGIGGAIENAADAGLVQWAVYFCRYSAFILPFAPHAAQEVAADNASYKRAALDRCRAARRDGFWEPTVHAAMTRDGPPLWKTPDIVVRHTHSFTLLEFVRQRFLHGWQFGGERARGFSPLRRGVYVAFSPLIPLVLLGRIARRVLAKKRHRVKLALCLPILALFLLSWCAGELCGCLQASRQPDTRRE